MRNFEVHHLPPDWPSFLDDFQQHWPTDEPHTYVDFVRHSSVGDGEARSGSPRWRRICEERCKAKSVFHFDVQGSVAKSTHAGIPWLRYLRRELAESVHFWPFDGWEIPAGKSAIVEAYPALYKRQFPVEYRNADQHDAYSIAAWMRQADQNGKLPGFLSPDLPGNIRGIAGVEGWILGVT